MHRIVYLRALWLAGMALMQAPVLAEDKLAPQDVLRVERTLASFAAETRMLLDQWQQGSLTDVYAKVHLEKLRDEVADTRDELDAPVSPDIKPRRDRDAALAEMLKSSLETLSSKPQDSDVRDQADQVALRIRGELKE